MKKKDYKNANLMFYGNFVDADIKLEDLGDFLVEVIAFIENTKNRLPSERFPNMPLHEFESLKDHYVYTFGEILRKSFILTLCIFLEKELGVYCKELQRQLKLDISWKDFKGSVLERFKLYANKLLKLKLSISDTMWQNLQGIISIRNCFVHADGYLENFSDKKRIQAFLKRHNSIMITDDKLEITDNGCYECLRIIKDFIKIIYDYALIYFLGDYGEIT